MSPRQLIVTADDVGLDRGMTEGAIRAHREGIVTACSIVANGAAFDDAVARLLDVPSLVTRLAREYAVPYVRIVDDRGGAARSLSISVLSALGRRAHDAAFTNDRTVGVAIAGHLDDVVPLLDHVEGVTELVTHPGVAVDGYGAWGYEWDRETRALCAPGLREETARRGIELTTPRAASLHLDRP